MKAKLVQRSSLVLFLCDEQKTRVKPQEMFIQLCIISVRVIRAAITESWVFQQIAIQLAYSCRNFLFNSLRTDLRHGTNDIFMNRVITMLPININICIVLVQRYSHGKLIIYELKVSKR